VWVRVERMVIMMGRKISLRRCFGRGTRKTCEDW